MANKKKSEEEAAARNAEIAAWNTAARALHQEAVADFAKVKFGLDSYGNHQKGLEDLARVLTNKYEKVTVTIRFSSGRKELAVEPAVPAELKPGYGGNPALPQWPAAAEVSAYSRGYCDAAERISSLEQQLEGERRKMREMANYLPHPGMMMRMMRGF